MSVYGEMPGQMNPTDGAVHTDSVKEEGLGVALDMFRKTLNNAFTLFTVQHSSLAVNNILRISC